MTGSDVSLIARRRRSNEAFGSILAQVTEVSVDAKGNAKTTQHTGKASFRSFLEFLEIIDQFFFSNTT